MIRPKPFLTAALLLGVALLLGACTGSSRPTVATSTPPAVAELPTPTQNSPTPEPAPLTSAPAAPARPAAPSPTLPPSAAALPTMPSPTATPTAEPATVTARPTAEIPSPTPTSPPPAPRPTKTAAPAAGGGTQRPALVIDHRSVDQFAAIPDQYIQAAAALSMFFMDRSVGKNISEGLDCLLSPSTAEARNHCRVSQHVNPAFSVSPDVLAWSRPGGYDRSKWTFLGYPEGCDSSWLRETGCFMDTVEKTAGQYRVVGYQLTYFDVQQGSSIDDQPGGFFSDNPDKLDVYDLAAFEAKHPDKTFIYWTSSLARGIGSPESVTFNDQMRQYAAANGKVLFDVADILSHDPAGNPCYDNRDGVPYNNGNKAEDYPDDGQNLLAICPHYTTEIDGGHLGNVSAGKIRVTKAFWVLMARLAGWTG